MTINLTFFSDFKRGLANSQTEESGAVCIANISPYERRKRVRFAALQFTVTLVILGVLIALEINPLWRLPLFFLFSASMVSFFQSRDKT
jgi:hypothetical protein